jgi:DNA-directed RNA polymerase specialized sigma24 family protein
MKRDWILTQELFDELLVWLNADSELAGREYEDIRGRLVKLFICRHCHEAEDLADETINRVANKVKEIKDVYVGLRAPYFYAVANRVHKEYLRRKPEPVPPPPPRNTEDVEREFACLEQCMAQQTPANRRLVLEYYRGEKRAKIEHRKKLAEHYEIALNALRIRAHRIRTTLQDCLENCISQATA